MDIFTMVVVIVIVGCVAGVCNKYLDAKKNTQDVEVDEAGATELDALRERVEVLEKIVTDEKYTLTRELDNLERQA
jgi:ABC-type Fe3+-citrate transport system substrate-binding protein